jgi:DNA repair photolyase
MRRRRPFAATGGLARNRSRDGSSERRPAALPGVESALEQECPVVDRRLPPPPPLRPALTPHKGRGATFDPENRYRREHRERVDDGWPDVGCFNDGLLDGGSPDGPTPGGGSTGGGAADETASPPAALPVPPPKTEVRVQAARTIIARNDSPDIPFTQSINPYQGCEHGCIYCYARPSHAYLDLSPGLDFETKLFAKPDAAELLRAELAAPGYRCEPIALGANTDPYQPIERDWKITRQVIELLAACEHPLTITTKGALIERDLDLLAPLAAKGLVRVFVSIAMLDRELARKLDPRAASPQRRLEAVQALARAGVPVGVNVAPIIPQLTDKDLEAVLEAAAAAGASYAGWTMLRLPREVAPLFRAWLAHHYPLRAAHVMSVVRQIRGGRDNDSRFGLRMGGQGPFADLVRRRFSLACRRLGLDARPDAPLDTTRFRPPARAGMVAATPRAPGMPGRQLDLFGTASGNDGA